MPGHYEIMDKAFQLPFFAPQDRLPAAIESSGDILQEYTGRRVVRSGDYHLVKYGANVSLTEGENMLFVREACSVPVPEVFALYSTRDTQACRISYIIMEYIPGHRLDD
ncbi:hypothetical protein HRG_005483 [Hirsutella rhossiliensis]|uniref:Aminoglycoside phosphotransferase domain-containing protein n=1 Tax=Hirsutella rhossiliensis TaxID=111463 RepID=A0A9P8SHC9_9HYPO|nr:uncharacterized protein HRG_05483 [Hirsutella rhossiliensis]KAH0962973.1 hypothetical protein HRG_05483 [Hirsutella rhossiliensis]